MTNVHHCVPVAETVMRVPPNRKCWHDLLCLASSCFPENIIGDPGVHIPLHQFAHHDHPAPAHLMSFAIKSYWKMVTVTSVVEIRRFFCGCAIHAHRAYWRIPLSTPPRSSSRYFAAARFQQVTDLLDPHGYYLLRVATAQADNC